jgi:hypothetical protein
MRRPSNLQVLALLGCFLTAAASADDFCLPRLVLPSSFAGEGLPLDDPNTDFIEATSAVPVLRAQSPDRAGAAAMCPAARLTIPAGFGSRFGREAAATRCSPGAELTPPLRC